VAINLAAQPYACNECSASQSATASQSYLEVITDWTGMDWNSKICFYAQRCTIKK